MIGTDGWLGGVALRERLELGPPPSSSILINDRCNEHQGL